MPTKGGKRRFEKLDPNERFTLRHLRRRKFEELHFDSLQQAIDRGVWDIHNDYAVPIEIRQGRKVLLEEDDIIDSWEERYLNPT